MRLHLVRGSAMGALGHGLWSRSGGRMEAEPSQVVLEAGVVPQAVPQWGDSQVHERRVTPVDRYFEVMKPCK